MMGWKGLCKHTTSIQLTSDKDDKNPFHKKQPIAKEDSPNSLKATIPEGIIMFLNLKAGDKLEWEKRSKGNERFVIVQKVKPGVS